MCYDCPVDNNPYFFSSKKKPKAKADSNTPAAPVDVRNLETSGEALKVYSLQNLLKNKRTSKSVPIQNFSTFIKKEYDKSVPKVGKGLDQAMDLWMQHVPQELQSSTRLVAFTRGTLTVAVTSSAMRAELEGLLRSGLLRTLQTASNGTIFRIKTSVQSSVPEIS